MRKPTIPPISQKKDITLDEAEKLIKGTKNLIPTSIKSCSYLLPCGICDKTNQMCSQYLK